MSLDKKTNGNWTELKTEEEVLIVSDVEGYMPFTQSSKIMEHIHHDWHLVYCGDLFDYTVIPGMKRPNENGYESEISRCCALKLLKYLVEKNNCYSVLGNRDINKIRLWQYVQNKEQTKWWTLSGDDEAKFNEFRDLHLGKFYIPSNIKDEYNNEMLLLTFLATKLMCEGGDKPDFWLIEDVSQFYPYWNATNKKVSDWYGWELDGKNELDTSKGSYLVQRYKAMFGADPMVGTMSAQNTDIGFFYDLCRDKETVDYFVTLLGDKFETWLSALTFVIYARLSDPTLKDPTLKDSEDAPYGWSLDGYLYRFLTESPIVAYCKGINDLFLFSHGGLHSDFDGKLPGFTKNQQFWKIIDDSKNDIKTQQGGSIMSLTQIDEYNQECHQLMDKYFTMEHEATISTELQTINALACGVKTFLKKLCPDKDNLDKCSTFSKLANEEDEKDALSYKRTRSPVVAEISSIKSDTKPLINYDGRITNIFGHVPSGFGYTFGHYNEKHRYICTDFSQSFFKNKFDIDDATYDENYQVLYCDLKLGSFSLEGQIYPAPRSKLDSGKYETFQDEFKQEDGFKFDNEEIKSIKSSIYLDGLVYGNYSGQTKPPPKKITFNFKSINEPINFKIPKNNDQNYHGSFLMTSTDDTEKIKPTRIDLYSMMGTPKQGFPKLMYIKKNQKTNNQKINHRGGSRSNTKKRRFRKIKKQSKKHQSGGQRLSRKRKQRKQLKHRHTRRH